MSLSEIGDKSDGEDFDRQYEDLLSKELLQLSVKDRNHLQEETHGVRCMAPEETPRMVEDSLKKLAIELDENIPTSEKRAYILSQQRPASKAFVNSREFRMRFLRCELFDYKLAAARLVRVCEALLNLFGRYALERPIRLSDFSSAELKVIRKGRLQPLPFRDRSGRRIGIMFPGKGALMGNQNSRNRLSQIKIFMYISWVLGLDVDTQRKGVVFVVWFDAELLESSALNDITQIKTNTKAHKVSMIRGSAVHICSPDTPFYRVQRSILSLGAGQWLKRLKSHLGEAVELRYILNGYGINTDTLPISWTGNVKVAYLKQWMRIRQYLEDPSLHAHSCDGCKFCCNSDSYNNQNGKATVCKFSLPIECPTMTDILFKKGKSAKNHPGNAHFRSRIQTKYEVERFSSNSVVASMDKTTSIIKSLVDYFCEEVQKGNLRVLMWNEKLSWWSILKDENVIRKKIENTVISSIESASSLHAEIMPRDEDLLEPNNCFDGCGGEGYSQDLKNVACTSKPQGQENYNKRRKIVLNSTRDGNPLGSWDLHDTNENCSLKRFFG